MKYVLSFLLIATATSPLIAQKKRSLTSKASASKPVEVTDSSIKKILNSDLAVLMVEASWCSHCQTAKTHFIAASEKSTAPISWAVISLGKDFHSKSALLKAIEKEYNITIDAIPTFLIFKKNVLVEELSGTLSSKQLLTHLTKQTPSQEPTKLAAAPEVKPVKAAASSKKKNQSKKKL